MQNCDLTIAENNNIVIDAYFSVYSGGTEMPTSNLYVKHHTNVEVVHIGHNALQNVMEWRCCLISTTNVLETYIVSYFFSVLDYGTHTSWLGSFSMQCSNIILIPLMLASLTLTTNLSPL